MLITREMWKHYVSELRDDKGGLLFCDSCHAGSAKVLDRSDKKALARFMTRLSLPAARQAATGPPLALRSPARRARDCEKAAAELEARGA